MQVDFICSSKIARTYVPSGYNWIADYAIIMLVHKIM